MRGLLVRFGEDGERRTPVDVAVTMTVSEAAVVARVLGRVEPQTPDVAEVHRFLSAVLFDPHWEAGVDDPDVPCDLPPLRDRIEIAREGAVSLRVEFEPLEENSRNGDWVIVVPGDVTVRVESWDLDADGQARSVADRISREAESW